MCAALNVHTHVQFNDHVMVQLTFLAIGVTLATLLGGYILYCLQQSVLPSVYGVASDFWQAVGPMLALLAKYDACLVLASVGQIVLMVLHNKDVQPRQYAVVFALCMIAAGKNCVDLAELPLKELMWSVDWWWKLLALFGSFTWGLAILLYGHEENLPEVMIPGLLCHILAAVVLLGG